MEVRPHIEKILAAGLLLLLLLACILLPGWFSAPNPDGAASPRSFSGDTVVCAIAVDDQPLTPEGLVAGLNIELIRRCAAADSFEVRFVRPLPGDRVQDSLAAGRYDLAVMPADSLEDRALERMPAAGSGVVWALAPHHGSKADSLERWLSGFMETEDYLAEQERFTCVRNPRKAFDRGRQLSRISPYDATLRAAARELQWDWRLLSALIYTESKFSLTAESRRGAFGLMQIVPEPGERDALLDPQNNLEHGTAHLRRLQRLFLNRGMEPGEDLDRIVVAAYNAGEGRMTDLMALAELKGLDPTRWESIREVIPLMAEHADSIETVARGRFHGGETLAYVDTVFTFFNIYQEILR